MSGYRPEATSARDLEMRARNRKLGLILGSIALAFFIGALLKYSLLR